jgi:ribonucleoside-diphosphate reductase alpha chain
MQVARYFSKGYGNLHKDPKKVMDYQPRDVEITDDSGEIVERIPDAIFPSFWGQDAANTVATKYFRREGVPETGRERDIRQLVGRVAGKISEWGLEQGYVDEKRARNLEAELTAASLFQYGSFNSPVWFNLGLDLYGISGGHDKSYTIKDGEVVEVQDSYSNPQVSACFIVSPEDSIQDMIRVGAVVSSKVFKGGSGIGGDWTKVRGAGEPVTGGGVSSGAVRFMDVQDSCGRVIKSGGITRRAATMQSIAVWHPDMKEILKHKFKEEKKARVLIEGGSPRNWESHTIQDLRAQNVNISIRTDDAFWEAYEKGELYTMRRIKDGEPFSEEPARDLALKMAFATHHCGDPGIQNHTIINDWHTCKNSGDIWASNPCTEYMFLNNSACNLASINVLRFRREDGSFDIDSFIKAVDLYITAQDILVSRASYPTEDVAWNSHIFRPLGLGYANLGAYIMSMGWTYDSDEARDFAAAVTSLMTSEAYLQSTKLAEDMGAFQEFEKNREPMLEVIEKHRKASRKINPRNGLEEIIETANRNWDKVVKRGGEYGFRNSQVTLLAPTGTIGYMMGCDTTGCEPEYALKKYKELAGGGSMTIVNETVPLALENLGYSSEEIGDIRQYIDENETVEGCPSLNDEHIPVFDCAISSGSGTRAISPLGHIKMLGAIQPLLSGAISKTINCPNNTSVEEIEDMFYQGWKHGLKAVSIYRDGSKASQPLRTKKEGELAVLLRGERKHMPQERIGKGVKVKIGGIPLFIRTGEYEDGTPGEIFIDSLERGSEVNKGLNLAAIQFSEKLQYGVPWLDALEIFNKAGLSQILGSTDHPFITEVRGLEDFLFKWLSAHYSGDISFVLKQPEERPLPWELRVYEFVPPLHLIPSVAGEGFYPDVPTLEETIERISGMNYWLDAEEGLDTRQTIEKIRRTRKSAPTGSISDNLSGRITGRICDTCGGIMISDGNCSKCPRCKTSTGGCGGG